MNKQTCTNISQEYCQKQVGNKSWNRRKNVNSSVKDAVNEIAIYNLQNSTKDYWFVSKMNCNCPSFKTENIHRNKKRSKFVNEHVDTNIIETQSTSYESCKYHSHKHKKPSTSDEITTENPDEISADDMNLNNNSKKKKKHFQDHDNNLTKTDIYNDETTDFTCITKKKKKYKHKNEKNSVMHHTDSESNEILQDLPKKMKTRSKTELLHLTSDAQDDCFTSSQTKKHKKRCADSSQIADITNELQVTKKKKKRSTDSDETNDILKKGQQEEGSNQRNVVLELINDIKSEIKKKQKHKKELQESDSNQINGTSEEIFKKKKKRNQDPTTIEEKSEQQIDVSTKKKRTAERTNHNGDFLNTSGSSLKIKKRKSSGELDDSHNEESNNNQGTLLDAMTAEKRTEKTKRTNKKKENGSKKKDQKESHAIVIKKRPMSIENEPKTSPIKDYAQSVSSDSFNKDLKAFPQEIKTESVFDVYINANDVVEHSDTNHSSVKSEAELPIKSSPSASEDRHIQKRNKTKPGTKELFANLDFTKSEQKIKGRPKTRRQSVSIKTKDELQKSPEKLEPLLDLSNKSIEELYEEADATELDYQLQKQLKNLNVLIPWSVPAFHLIETRVSAPPLPKQKTIIKELGVTVKTGVFSSKEDKILLHNWKKFCSLHDLPEDPEPFINPRYRKVIPLQEKQRFVRFLAHNLDNRLLWTVFTRFKRLISSNKRKIGKYSHQEDKVIIEYMKTTESASFYADLARMLHRDKYSIVKRCEILLQKYNFLKWDLAQIEKLVNEIVDVTQVFDVSELKLREISSEEWNEISDRLNIDKIRAQKGWLLMAYPRLFIQKSLNTSIVKRKVIELLIENGVTDWKSIDWDDLVRDFNGLTSLKLKQLVQTFIHYHVPLEKQHSLKECLNYLKETLAEKKLSNSKIKRIKVANVDYE